MVRIEVFIFTQILEVWKKELIKNGVRCATVAAKANRRLQQRGKIDARYRDFDEIPRGIWK